jgi:hypothetical protein
LKLSSIVLAPSENIPSQHRFPSIDSDDSSSDITGFDGPAMSEYLLTAADILNLKLHAKLVVLSSGYTDDRAGNSSPTMRASYSASGMFLKIQC